MAFKSFCDICDKEDENMVKIDMGMIMYCQKCWKDKKNWPQIHKESINFSTTKST